MNYYLIDYETESSVNTEEPAIENNTTSSTSDEENIENDKDAA